MNLWFFTFLGLGMAQTFQFTQFPTVVGPCEPMQLEWTGGRPPFEIDMGIPDVDGNFFTTRFFSTKDNFSTFPLQGVELASTIVRARIFDDSDDQITTKSIPVNGDDCTSTSPQDSEQNSNQVSPPDQPTVTVTTPTVFRTGATQDPAPARKISAGEIVGATIGSMSGLLVAILLLFYYRRRRARTNRESSLVHYHHDTIDTIEVGQGYSSSASEVAPGQTLVPLRYKERAYSETSSELVNPFCSPGTAESSGVVQDQAVTLSRIQEIHRVLNQLEQETTHMARASHHELEAQAPAIPRRTVPSFSTRSSQRPPAYENETSL